MSYDIDMQVRNEQPTLAKRATLPFEEVSQWFPAAYREVFDHLERIGVAPAGPPYARYDMHETTFDIEAGAPVAHFVEPAGGLITSSLPGGRVARTMHRGTYDTLDKAYDALRAWIRERGGQPVGPHYEVYLTDPQEVPDPAEWLTEVWMPFEEVAQPE